jgi:Fe2+ or Zn2+ uptake regulation protein
MIDRNSITVLVSPRVQRPTDDRFRLLVSGRPGSKTALHIYDRQDRRVLMKWRGEIARRLLWSGCLPHTSRTSGSHPCSKILLKRLSLMATRIELELAQDQALNDRLRALQDDIPPSHRRIAELLFSHPGRHLSEHEVISLMLLQYPCIEGPGVAALLEELVTWGVVQRVEVDAHRRFYDIDTRPHLHVYCPETDELRDAPASGVIRSTG